MRLSLLLAMAIGASFIGSNCGGSGIGDPCVPEEEYIANFPGFSEGEVNVESRSFQCLTRVCLVNHFRGRVSCPYGQDAATTTTCTSGEGACLPGSADHEKSCRVPDRDGTSLTDRISVVVDAQFEERKAANAVYCSCRCAGPDANARYCECPSGFSCEELVDDLGLGKGQLAGSYCVKDGTAYNKSLQTRCTADAGNCGYQVEGGRGVNPPNPAIDPATVL